MGACLGNSQTSKLRVAVACMVLTLRAPWTVYYTSISLSAGLAAALALHLAANLVSLWPAVWPQSGFTAPREQHPGRPWG